jgi:thioester reductase-like protein
MTEGEKERERLKEEYKQHFRKMKDAGEKIRRNRYVHNVNRALHNMDASELLSSFDHFLDQVRDKMTRIEARLDVAVEEILETSELDEELDTELRKQKAKESLKKIKTDMGMLYRDIEKQAEEYKAEKTVGRQADNQSDQSTK